MSSCEMCGEQIEPGQDAQPMNGGLYYAHRECLLRNVLGGIGHLTNHDHWCNTMHDPDGGLTYRQSGLGVDQWVRDHGIEAAAQAAGVELRVQPDD